MASTTGTKAARKAPAKAPARASKGERAPTKTPKSGATPEPSRRAATGRQRSGDDWEAAKEILTAHRTLARAERRENTLAAALKPHGKTAKTLQAELKKVYKLLERADEELASSVRHALRLLSDFVMLSDEASPRARRPKPRSSDDVSSSDGRATGPRAGSVRSAFAQAGEVVEHKGQITVEICGERVCGEQAHQGCEVRMTGKIHVRCRPWRGGGTEADSG